MYTMQLHFYQRTVHIQLYSVGANQSQLRSPAERWVLLRREEPPVRPVRVNPGVGTQVEI